MKRSILLLFGILSFSIAQSQSYRTAAGLRFDSNKSLGLTVQQKIYDNMTIEGMLLSNTSNGDVSATVLVEQHNKIIFKNFNIYFGAGIHKTWHSPEGEERDYRGAAGPAGVVGVEASLGRLNFSWDVQPKANVWGGNRFLNMNSGFSMRYIILKKKKKKFNWKFWKKK